jgi:hypothetical protein
MVADFSPAPNYDRVLCVTGHPCKAGMDWHRKNSLNGAYTKQDASNPLGAQGAMRQTPTNPCRVHREKPELIGQQLVMDAFTSTDNLLTGNKHCYFLKCLKSQWVHPLFTKNRSAAELVRVITLFFNRHPEYRREASQDRFVRCDPEPNYRSAEFVACFPLSDTVSKELHRATSSLTVSQSALPVSSSLRLYPNEHLPLAGILHSSMPAPHTLSTTVAQSTTVLITSRQDDTSTSSTYILSGASAMSTYPLN